MYTLSSLFLDFHIQLLEEHLLKLVLMRQPSKGRSIIFELLNLGSTYYPLNLLSHLTNNTHNHIYTGEY
jgi:hypothetical protein